MARVAKQPTRGARKRNPSKRKAKAAPDLPVEAIYLEVNLVGQQRNEAGDVQGAATMWSGQIFPADFGKLEQMLREALEEHKAPVPASLRKEGEV